jgi:hypothetical protein
MQPQYEPIKFPFPPRTLDDCMLWAEDYANQMMRVGGSVRPTYLFVCANGMPGIFVFSNGAFDVEDKEKFSKHGKFVCLANNAIICVFVAEMYVITRDHNTLGDELPSEALDREEGVQILGEAQEGHMTKAKFLRTIRNDRGEFFNFGPSEHQVLGSAEGGEVEGRFSRMLPPIEPPKEIQEMAQMWLAIHGLKRQTFTGDQS